MNSTSAYAARSRSQSSESWLLFTLTVLVFAGSVIKYCRSATHQDVSWFLLAARRLLDGGQFGRDIYELNAPAAALIYAPAAWLWKALGLDAQMAMVIEVAGLAAISLGLVNFLLRRELGASGNRLRAAFFLFSAAIILGAPGRFFGQREHFIFILFLPYCFTSIRLTASTNFTDYYVRGLSVFMAALAVSVKPIYVLFPLTILAVQTMQRGIGSMSKDFDLRLFVLLGFLYAAVIVVFFRPWLDIAGHAVQLYGAYSQPEYFSQGTNLQLLVTMPLLLMGFGLNHGLARPLDSTLYARINACLSLAGVSILLFVAQKKGWSYQLLPGVLSLGLAAGALLLAIARYHPQQRWATAAFAILVAGAIAIAGLTLTQATGTSKREVRESPLAQIVDKFGSSSVISAFSTSLSPMFPMITELNLQWGSRFPCLWTLAGIRGLELSLQAQGDGKNSPASKQLEILEDETVSMIVDDLERYQPALVIVDGSVEKQALDPGFDILKRLLSHPNFQRAWNRYSKLGNVGSPDGSVSYALYERQPKVTDEPSADRTQR